MNARLYANENFPLPAVEALRALGHDVLTTREASQDNKQMSDEEVLAFAIQDQRCVLTLNRKHFIRLHATQPSHRGIIVCTFDPDFHAQAQRIHAAIRSLDSLDGQLVRINREC